MLLFSIITINLNNATGLQKTLNSVFIQTFTNFEYIVIDGGSTDKSKELIEANSHQLAYWASEPDAGIYHAMNKGIAIAKGEYLLFLNSGDYLNDSQVLAKVFAEQPVPDIIYGDITWETAGIHTHGLYPNQLTFDYFTNHSLPHQGAFIRKQLFSTVGLYDQQYAIIADWVFFLLAIYKFNCTYHHIGCTIAVCNRDGLSCDVNRWPEILWQRQEVIQHNFAAFAADYQAFLAERNELKKIKKMMGFRLQKKLQQMIRK